MLAMLPDELLVTMVDIHQQAERAELRAQNLRAQRDALVAEAVDAGVTPYRIAKLLDVATTSPARMIQAHQKRAA